MDHLFYTNLSSKQFERSLAYLQSNSLHYLAASATQRRDHPWDEASHRENPNRAS